jgi:DNA-directed RNA polymerase specialized sigma24 family protein
MSPEQLLLVILGARLTPRQTDAFLDNVLLGRPQVEIAREVGVSGRAINQSVTQARRKMRPVVLGMAA